MEDGKFVLEIFYGSRDKTLIAEFADSKPVFIIITSEVVKKITVDGLLGKGKRYRYFFDIHNKDSHVFDGKISITMKTKNGFKYTEKINVNIQPGLHKSVYFDCLTGPENIHGDSGFSSFEYTLPSGICLEYNTITNKFSDSTY